LEFAGENHIRTGRLGNREFLAVSRRRAHLDAATMADIGCLIGL
jgi:hypothetical protein